METMTLSRWYGRSVRVPGYGSYSFIPFTTSCIGLVSTLLDRGVGKKLSVTFVSGGTASADQENNRININENYLHGDFGFDKKVKSEDALTAILGIIIHETAHFAYSPPTLLPAADYVKAHTKCAYNQQIAATLFNIVEDIFIEAEVDRAVPRISWMLDELNAITFDAKDTGERVEKARDITSAPDSVESLTAAMNLLILAKMYESMDGVASYMSDLFAAARSATEMPRLADRFALTLYIYDALMCNMTTKMLESKGGKEKIEEIKGLVSGYTDNRDGSGKGIEAAENSEARRINELSSELEKCTMSLPDEEVVPGRAIRGITFNIEVPLLADTHALDMDKRYQRLAEVARQRAVVNRPYGADKTRGNNIRKLYRISTDQKIFAEPVRMGNYKPMQVIILIDCSGSMGSSGTREACRAALGAAYGLTEGRCEVAVYGHTSDVISGGELTIYKAKTFNEPIEVLDRRLFTLTKQLRSQNRDGFAIQYLGKKFNPNGKKCLLIVISDGAPEAPGYSGPEANRHTKDCVEALRQRKIDVLSISIEHSARRTNNYIYGEKWNVFNTDPNVIEEVVRSLVIN